MLITRWIVLIVKKLGLLPVISETEKIALRSGSVWVDGEFFTGKPNFTRILSEPYPELSSDEKAFLEGPVEELCRIVDDWQVYQDRDLPPKVWEFLKKKKFFGMIIPKKWGGLGFSALGHSAVIQKLASRSLPLSVTVMVPNSLGPAELLLHYGTDAQKKHYLARLADGRDIPCFALTEPEAGSDAGSITSHGEVFKGKDGKIYLKLTWEKRYITLAAISTVLGLAFRLRDPQNLLGKGENPGITCALLPSKTPGVILGRRHDPMGVPFFNAPTTGKDVVFPIDVIIGGVDGVGQGWKMLMECLAAGRGISLPATAAGGTKLVARTISAYGNIRKQFGLSVGKFEGIEEAIARIAGASYYLEAGRRFTAGGIDSGAKPPIASAIAKYQFTEIFRKVINDGMDIVGGAGISRGPRNLFANAYTGLPISITVEGANIMTRTLILFGQGAIRCHPYAYREIEALATGNTKEFDKAFFLHIRSGIRNFFRAGFLTLTRGRLAGSPVSGPSAPYIRKLMWASAVFALFTDIALALLGGGVKRKEKINGRFGDMLSWLYLASSTIRRFEAEGRSKADLPLLKYSMALAFYEMQVAYEGLLKNLGEGTIFSCLFKGPLLLLARINPFGLPASDKLGHDVTKLLMSEGETKEKLTRGIYISKDPKDALGRLEYALGLYWQVQAPLTKIAEAIRAKKLPKRRPEDLSSEALAAKIISKKEAELIVKESAVRHDAVMVDSFTLEEYRTYGKKK
jgi:acyl-CoA dehydrogenase